MLILMLLVGCLFQNQFPSHLSLQKLSYILMEQMQECPITADHIKTWTHCDPVLSHVVQFVQHGWPSSYADKQLQPFWQKRLELSCQDGCLLWGNHIVIPIAGCTHVLEELHEAHPALSALSVLPVLWPGIDHDRAESEILSRMPDQPSITSWVSITAMEMAYLTLVSSPCRLCRTMHGTYIPHSHWCSFQVDWSAYFPFHHLNHYHAVPTSHFCYLWSSWLIGHRKWTQLCELWNWPVSKTELHQAQDVPTLSPSLQWVTRTCCIQTFKRGMRKMKGSIRDRISRLILVCISEHTSEYYWFFPSWTAPGSQDESCTRFY